MQRGFLLDVVIRERTSIFELFAGKNQTLLIGWDSFLVLNLRLYIVNRIRRFHVQRDGLAGQGLDKNLNETREASVRKNQNTRRMRERTRASL